MIQGESGVGKELAARASIRPARTARPLRGRQLLHHPRGHPPRGCSSARCAAPSPAPRRRTGHIAAAHGGVLFLDEFGELHPGVQAKLLRVLETHEVIPLGSTEARVRRRAGVLRVADEPPRGVSPPDGSAPTSITASRGGSVSLAPLRERREEIPWLAAVEARSGGERAHAPRQPPSSGCCCRRGKATCASSAPSSGRRRRKPRGPTRRTVTPEQPARRRARKARGAEGAGAERRDPEERDRRPRRQPHRRRPDAQASPLTALSPAQAMGHRAVRSRGSIPGRPRSGPPGPSARIQLEQRHTVGTRRRWHRRCLAHAG
jgi:hypothetical protein